MKIDKSPLGTNLVCTHCGRKNHIDGTCFMKPDYPLWFKNKGKVFQLNGFDDSKGNIDTYGAGSSNSKSSNFTQEKYYSLVGLLQ